MANEARARITTHYPFHSHVHAGVQPEPPASVSVTLTTPPDMYQRIVECWAEYNTAQGYDPRNHTGRHVFRSRRK
jgi:hypothetical protein